MDRGMLLPRGLVWVLDRQPALIVRPAGVAGVVNAKSDARLVEITNTSASTNLFFWLHRAGSLLQSEVDKYCAKW
jgi:hypothetical protein